MRHLHLEASGSQLQPQFWFALVLSYCSLEEDLWLADSGEMLPGGIHQHPGPCLPALCCTGAGLLLQKYPLSLSEVGRHGNYYMLWKLSSALC